jgi:hypothetical protein
MTNVWLFGFLLGGQSHVRLVATVVSVSANTKLSCFFAHLYLSRCVFLVYVL